MRRLLLQLRRGVLVSKAAPGPWMALTEIYARDAFFTALDDSDLRRRIMLTYPPPTTLAAAYDLALRASAFDATEKDSREEVRHWSPNHQLRKRIDELRTTLSRITSNAIVEQPRGWPRAPSTKVEWREAMRADARRRPPFHCIARNACRPSGEHGHRARECPSAHTRTE